MGKDGGMRPLQSHSPYSLYKKTTKSGVFWYVRFWDDVQKKYTWYRSTGIPVEGKRERRAEAEKAAIEMLPDSGLIRQCEFSDRNIRDSAFFPLSNRSYKKALPGNSIFSDSWLPHRKQLRSLPESLLFSACPPRGEEYNWMLWSYRGAFGPICPWS